MSLKWPVLLRCHKNTILFKSVAFNLRLLKIGAFKAPNYSLNNLKLYIVRLLKIADLKIFKIADFEWIL